MANRHRNNLEYADLKIPKRIDTAEVSNQNLMT